MDERKSSTHAQKAFNYCWNKLSYDLCNEHCSSLKNLKKSRHYIFQSILVPLLGSKTESTWFGVCNDATLIYRPHLDVIKNYIWHNWCLTHTVSCSFIKECTDNGILLILFYLTTIEIVFVRTHPKKRKNSSFEYAIISTFIYTCDYILLVQSN